MSTERAFDAVFDDVTRVLGEVLRAADDQDGFAVAQELAAVRDDPITSAEQTYTAIPWTWSGRNEGARLLGLDPTGRRITVRGMTIVRMVDDQPILHRYIDWLDVLGQMGVAIYGRPIIDSGPDGDEPRQVPGVEEILAVIERRPHSPPP